MDTLSNLNNDMIINEKGYEGDSTNSKIKNPLKVMSKCGKRTKISAPLY